MQGFDSLLLRVWREACKHIEIARSAASIAAEVLRDLPMQLLVVDRLDLSHACLETVACESSGGDAPTPRTRVDLSPDQLGRLIAWGTQRRAMPLNECPAIDALAAGLSTDARNRALVGALTGAAEMIGLVLILPAPSLRMEQHHRRLIDALLEPFSAALENDRRLSEIKTLREAAEADRRSLLARLGRREISTTIVGSEAGLRQVMDRVETVCRADVPVLLLGETGTGKEVIARAIHDRSARRDGPFIRVNCGAIPPELIDSHLFGHERGSFTGAVGTHIGWFERADKGTLFLDEIGELPPAAQVRLLRVLQDGFIERVGGRQSIHVDVRIVAATHRNLASMARDGGFRQDLWYRVAVFPIPIPPLRDRPDDIAALACHFAQKAATRFGLALVMPTPDDIRRLAAYPWPGNVRELAAVIDRAALLGNGRALEIATALGPIPGISSVIPAGPAGELPRAPAAPAAPSPAPQPLSSAPLDDAMRTHIESVLATCRGRVEGPFGAAVRLRINPHTLRSRMRRLGIDWRRFRG